VERAVFDIIPTADPDTADLETEEEGGRQPGDRCPCVEDPEKDLICFLDTKLKCRVSLLTRPDSSWTYMKWLGTDGTKERRGKFRHNKKKTLRNLFTKWIKEQRKKKENTSSVGRWLYDNVSPWVVGLIGSFNW